MQNQPSKSVQALARWLTNLVENSRNLPRLPLRLVSGLADLLLSLSSLVVVVFKRLRHNLGLSISAILGVVAVLSMVVGVPIFSYSISSEVLRQQLVEKALNTRRGLFSLHMYFVSSSDTEPITLENVKSIQQYLFDATPRLLSLPTQRILTEAQTTSILWFPEQVRGMQKPEESWISMTFVTHDDLQQKAEIVEGAWPTQAVSAEGTIQVAVLETTADTYFMNVGDRFYNGPLQIEIAGIWRPLSLDSLQWYDLPRTAYANAFWVPAEVFTDVLPKYLERPIFYASWYVMMDETTLRFDRAIQYAQGMIRMSGELSRLAPGLTIDYSPMEALQAYLDRSQRLTNLFYAIGGPMVVLALLFIGLTATIAVQQYEQETATMRGRGTSWWQIVSLNLIESLILIVIAIPISVITGWLAAYLMSQTLSFLQFSNRGTLPFTLQGVNLNWILLAAGFVILSRFAPTFGISRTTIIRVKQEQSRSIKKPLWQRLYLDFFLLLPGLYAYLTLSGLAEPTQFILEAYETASSDEPYRDPLLFIAPALFAMAVCMIALRVLPLVFRIISALVDRLPGVWPFLAMQQIARRPQDHSSALLLIMMSLSLSIYSASSAKTLDKWMHDTIYYQYGADLVVHEYILEGGDTAGGVPGVSTGASTISDLDLNVAAFLSLEDHLKLPNVEGATRVGKYIGTYSFGVGEAPCVFMGIDRLDFPGVAFYREDFSDQSLGGLMNALGGELYSVLVPRSLAEEKDFQIGDRLLMSANVLDQSYEREMVITGIYDYFPTVYPSNRPTFIINLEALFDNPDSVIGYDVWLNLEEDTDTEFLLSQISRMMGSDDAVVKVPGNSLEEFQKTMAEPERIGVFGVLNVGFIATGLMPGIGFVLYSYASLRRRFIQLGILQAIGLSVAQLIGYLVLEQFMLMGLAIVFGASIGLLASSLFLPFLQVGSSPFSVVPPFDVLIGWAESGWLSIGFGLVLVLTIIGTVFYLARIKVFQAVKMGEAL
jgi:putative ABC transport system permease protein